jgi:photosystem II stability/assembly factor-like uncharacterized protein
MHLRDSPIILLYVGTDGHGLYRMEADHPGFEPIGGNALGSLHVSDIVTAPDGLVYAVTTEGVVVIEGAAWRKLASLPDAPASLAIDPQQPDMLYVGTVGYGLFLSTDGGETWQSRNNGLGWQPGIILNVSAVAVDPRNPQHLALATAIGVSSHLAGDGIYESFNAGENWVKITDRQEVTNQIIFTQNGAIFTVSPKGVMMASSTLYKRG